jgi:predicted nucleotide-binding protein
VRKLAARKAANLRNNKALVNKARKNAVFEMGIFNIVVEI